MFRVESWSGVWGFTAKEAPDDMGDWMSDGCPVRLNAALTVLALCASRDPLGIAQPKQEDADLRFNAQSYTPGSVSFLVSGWRKAHLTQPKVEARTPKPLNP